MDTRDAGARDRRLDLVGWNSPDTWKFAWPGRILDYVCFGESAWGDQYAYRRDELERGSDPSVYFLEWMTLRAEALADTFEEFLMREFLRNCTEPYDTDLVTARRRLGDLRLDEHITLAPSPLITGTESLEQLTKMDSVAAMVANGDLCSQLADVPQSRVLASLAPYTDAQGRLRIRCVWAD